MFPVYCSRGSQANLDTYLPQVTLFGWVCLGGPRLSLDGLVVMHNEKQPHFKKNVERFIQEAIVDGVGAEAVFVRLEQDVRDRRANPESQSGEWCNVLRIVSTVARHPSMRPYLQTRETFGQLVQGFAHRVRQSRSNAYDETIWMEWACILEFARYALT